MNTFRLRATITLDVQSDLDLEAVRKAIKKATKKMARPEGLTFNVEVKKVVEKAAKAKKAEKPKKIDGTEVLAELSPDEVWPHVGKGKHTFAAGGKEYAVKMTSQRLVLFRDNPCCAACGIQGTKFRLERQGAAVQPHFNLYADDAGTPVLMTKDHIKPKSKGGEDAQSNFQTMCSVCNCLKSNSPLTLTMIRQLRETLRANKGLPKKALAKLMNDEKARLLAAGTAEAIKERLHAPMWTCSDLGLFDLGGGELWGYAGTAKVDEMVPHVACVRRKTPVTPVHHAGEVVTVKLRCGSSFKTWLRNLSQTE